MKIQCPKCREVQDVRKDDVMGRYLVCRSCHHTFPWEAQVRNNKPNGDACGGNPNCA